MSLELRLWVDVDHPGYAQALNALRMPKQRLISLAALRAEPPCKPNAGKNKRTFIES